MTLIQTISHPSRIHDIAFCARPSASSSDDEVLLVAAEDKKVSVYAVRVRSPGNRSHKRSAESSGGSNTDTDDAPKSDIEAEYRVVAEIVGHENRLVFIPRDLF